MLATFRKGHTMTIHKRKRKNKDSSRTQKQSKAYGSCASDLFLPPRYLSLYLKLDTHLIPMSGFTIIRGVADSLYLGEFCLLWHACGGTGRVKVDVSFEASPLPEHRPHVIAADQGPDDRFLFMATKPGSYLFRAKAVDTEGFEAFDTLVVVLPD